jgi:pimeloyl-ACP methyl ester carboxylesterase
VGQQAVESIRHSELVMIDEAGHMLQFEQPDVFNSAVGAWLVRNGL